MAAFPGAPGGMPGMDPNAGLSEQEAQMVKYVRALSFARGEAAPLFVLEEQWKENLGRSNGHLRTFC
jgi:hypothetical protein